MKRKTENPAAVVSKELIIESLFDMLAIKPLSSITISEIAENANVDRRTFYRHFKTKNDVIKYYIYAVLKQYEKILLKKFTSDGHLFVKIIFEAFLSMNVTLQILNKQNLLDLFLTEFEILYEKYQYQLTKSEILKIENIDYILTYERGGIINMIKKWITNGLTISPQNMTDIFEQMFLIYKENL